MGTSTTSTEARILIGESLSKAIVDAVPGGLIQLRTDGSVVMANQEAARFFRLDLPTLLTRGVSNYSDLTLDEDGRKMRADELPIVRAITTGEAQVSVTAGLLHEDGDVGWAVWNATPVVDGETREIVGGLLSFVDITERRSAEQALVESEARLAALVASAPNTVVGADLDGTIRYINRLLEHQTPDDVIGQSSIYDFFDPETRGLVREVMGKVIATCEPATYEAPGHGPTDPTWYEVHVGPVIEGDDVKGVTLIITDVTEKKALEGRLLIADRLASVGTLAAGVAHEINNPLTYLLANIDWLQRDYADQDPKLARRLQQAMEGAERIRAVVRDLSSFSQSQETTSVPVELTDVLDSALRMTASEMRHRARVVKDYGPISAKVNDGARLGQVFVNLLINAAQAIPAGNMDGNEIRISTEVTAAGAVQAIIRDTGIGIARDVVQHVFDPFVTTKPPGVGTGLGLYVSHNIVASLGGSMWVQSAEGQGTMVTVELPQATGEEQSRTSAPPSDVHLTARARILVVDDEDGIRGFLRDSLHEHDVEAVNSGREAIERLTTESFDVIICDLIMPDITGMDVFRRIEEDLPALSSRVIFVTGATFSASAREFLDSVANPRLAKPFTSHAIRRAVAKALRSRDSSDKAAG